MPTPKQRRANIHKRQLRREKRRKLVELTSNEKRRLSQFKIVNRAILYLFGNIESNNSLDRINRIHKKNFALIAKNLHKKFPGETLVVVSEGAGRSSFGRELEKELTGEARVEIIRTDLDQSVNPTFYVSPEELSKKIPANSAHIVESTYGGSTYTKISQEKAIANIIHILKPGGVASVATLDVFEFGKTPKEDIILGRHIGKEDLLRIKKRFPNIKIEEESFEGQVMGRLCNGTILTIHKLH